MESDKRLWHEATIRGDWIEPNRSGASMGAVPSGAWGREQEMGESRIDVRPVRRVVQFLPRHMTLKTTLAVAAGLTVAGLWRNCCGDRLATPYLARIRAVNGRGCNEQQAAWAATHRGVIPQSRDDLCSHRWCGGDDTCHPLHVGLYQRAAAT